MSELFESAMRYAELGYAVFPCVPGRKEPLCAHGCLDATTDETQIESWWSEHPHANIGISTPGLLVLDVDAQSTWLASDADKLLELAVAPLSLTANAGRQYFFRQPPGRHWRNTTGRLAPHVDTRADGGYVVAPPSILAGGRAYRWANELDVVPEKLPEPPAWLTAELDRLATSSPTTARVAASGEDANPIPSGQRNATLARLAGTMRRVGMSLSEIAAAIHAANSTRCQPPLPKPEVDRIAASVARYEPDQIATAVVEDHWSQVAGVANVECPLAMPDPGPLPVELLRVPGFVSEVMDYCLETAPYPNPALAFCGALALQAVLAGRKVRDSGDNRTNIYLLGLAHSASGKDWPRKVNTRILHMARLAECLGERFASGEGIQDALFLQPCMLFQTDEIDGMLTSINKSKDARHEAILSTLLTMYSSSNSVFPMRRKAGKEALGVIDQPCLVIFGTAIPNHYYQALSERMLTNGFFARMIIVEAGQRGSGQEPSIRELPARVLEAAKWWSEFEPGPLRNLVEVHPNPIIVAHTDHATRRLIATREEAEGEYSKCEAAGDPVGTTVWGRVSEHTRKLALLHAVSNNHKAPIIDHHAVEWASQFVMHQTRRMLFMAASHVAENPFHAECLRLLQKLREVPERQLPHSVLLKRMKLDSRTFQDLITTLEQQGDLMTCVQTTGGRPQRAYRLVNIVGETRGERSVEG